MGRKRLYKLHYKETNEPAFVEDAGHLLKISGILMQGMGSSVLFLSPTSDEVVGLETIKPTVGEWCKILEQTDDPLIYQQDETGTIKAVQRKQEHAISGAVQQHIWVRDGFRCLYCGTGMAKETPLTVDHFVPLEMYGAETEDNLISACRKCNKRKGNQDPEKYCRKHGLDYEGLTLYLAGKAPLVFVAHLA